MNRESKANTIKKALKAKNVNVVNVPTVKIQHDSPEMKELPSLHLSSEDLPELKDWKVGGSYKLELTVEQTSLSKGDYDYIRSGSKGKLRASFKIKSVKAIK